MGFALFLVRKLQCQISVGAGGVIGWFLFLLYKLWEFFFLLFLLFF